MLMVLFKREVSFDDSWEDKHLYETIRVSKDCLGIDTTLRVLCDASYIRSLAACYKDPRDIRYSVVEHKNAHRDIMRLFGVKLIDLDTTWCVVAEIKTRCEADGLFGDKAHELNCALMMRAFACGHHGKAINAEACVQGVIEGAYLWPRFLLKANAFLPPYVLASTDDNFYVRIQERTGVPVLTVLNERKTVLPLTPSLKNKLDAVKEIRLESMEKEALRRAFEAEETVKEKGLKKGSKKGKEKVTE